MDYDENVMAMVTRAGSDDEAEAAERAETRERQRADSEARAAERAALGIVLPETAPDEPDLFAHTRRILQSWGNDDKYAAFAELEAAEAEIARLAMLAHNLYIDLVTGDEREDLVAWELAERVHEKLEPT